MNFLRLYKPNKIDDFNIEPIYKEIIELYKKENNLRFIINGNNSVGKTTLIKVILEEYYNKKFSELKDNIIYINYIKDQGINYYRNELKQFCQINKFKKEKKNTIIIDDLDLINFNSQQIVKTYITNYKNINFWYLSYSIGLFFGYFTYKIPTKKDSLVLYCDKCIKENKDKRIKRMINEVKELFQNRPVTFCYNNMSDECLSIWNYITTKYLE